jgi:hypothetical protein
MPKVEKLEKYIHKQEMINNKQKYKERNPENQNWKFTNL